MSNTFCQESVRLVSHGLLDVMYMCCRLFVNKKTMCVYLKNVQKPCPESNHAEHTPKEYKYIKRREERSTEMCIASASPYLNKNPILDAAQCPKVEKQRRNMSEH